MNDALVPMIGTIKEVIDEASDIRTLTIALKGNGGMTTLPGQFIEFTVFGRGEFPVSISGASLDGRYLKTTIQTRGRATDHVAALKCGDSVGIRGPLGNGYPMNDLMGKDVYVVTGGIGLAAVWLLLDTMLADRQKYGKITLLHGAKCADDMIYRESFLLDPTRASKLGIGVLTTVDVGDSCWEGNIGLVTSLFDKVEISPDNAYAVICGPEAMMKVACLDLLQRGFNSNRLLLSLERRMQCGVGTCGHCMVGEKRVCANGPVFKYNEIRMGIERSL